MLGGLIGRLIGSGGRGSVGGIQAYVGADISDYEKKMRQADQTMKKTASSMSSEIDKGAKALSGGLGSLAGAVGIGSAVVLAQQLGSVVAELNTVGAESQRMNAAFVEQWGERAPRAMEALRAASHGAISDMDLMLSANRAKMLHVTDDYNELGRLLEVATARGRAMGLTTQQAFNDLVTGIGRISPMILDNLGILTGGDATFEAYAESIGKAGQELTDIEKRQALVNKVLSESVTVTMDAAGQAESLQVAKANLRAEIGGLVTDFITETGIVETLTEKLVAMRDQLSQQRESSASFKELYTTLGDLEKQGSLTREEAMKLRAELYGLQFAWGATDRAMNLEKMKAMEQSLHSQFYILSADEKVAALLAEKIEEVASQAGGSAAPLRTMAGALEGVGTEAYDAYTKLLLADAAMRQVNRTRMNAAYVDANDPSSQYSISTAGNYRVIDDPYELFVKPHAEALAKDTKNTRDAYAEQLSSQKSYATDSLRLAEQQFQALRGIVESALSPTAVTAADLAATAAGTYVDKWDEYMRRIRMPESGMGADQIAEQERLFYSGQMMDQINWGAVVSDVQRKVQEEAGREALVQEAMRQVQMAGIGASQSQVASALGITDFAAMGQEQQKALSAGFRADGLAVSFTDEFEDELGEQRERWVSMGIMSVEWMAEGIDKGATPEVTHRLVNLLVPRVAEALTGGARP